jgi:hypothetical protein
VRARVRGPTSLYEPRDFARRILHHLVRDHFETFRAQAASLRGVTPTVCAIIVAMAGARL